MGRREGNVKFLPKSFRPLINGLFEVIGLTSVIGLDSCQPESAYSSIPNQEVRQKRESDLAIPAVSGSNYYSAHKLHFRTKHSSLIIPPVNSAIPLLTDRAAGPDVWKRILHTSTMAGIFQVLLAGTKVLLNFPLIAYSKNN